DDSVRLVCFPHCSNVVGEINPVTEITALAHAAGAFVCVDGVSYAPHGVPDVGTLGPDIYLFSAYKTYGPHQGLMVIRRTLGELLPNQGHVFNSDTLYKRFTPAGPDHAQVAACAGMADYVDALFEHHGGAGDTHPSPRGQLVHDLMRARETDALSRVLAAVADRNDVRLLGPSDPTTRAPTVALDLGRDPVPVAAALAEHGVMAGGGDFYAGRALDAMGIDPARGVLRLSFTHYTSDAEIDQLLKALETVL
ncbi:MAG: aminotransferase class V-fold PLP-dependent enzyme, partial [Tateyamaria sp.]